MLDKVYDYEQKCEWIEIAIKFIGNISDDYTLCSKLLFYRYIKSYSTIKTCYLLGEDRANLNPEWKNEVMPKRTYDRYHQEALLEFAHRYHEKELLE